MKKILSVPIHIDAFLTEQPELVVSAMTYFNRLPYTDLTKDYNPDTVNISEDILSSPFQNNNLTLGKGLHLHWSLPDALTRGGVGGAGGDYPAVPNRWLVVRKRSDVTEKQWVVESDYLYPEEEESAEVADSSIVYPIDLNDPGKPAGSLWRPFRFMGRKREYSGWQEDAMAEFLPRLTALGYGEPAFAAFYPNCHSVFGCFDPDIDTRSQLTNLSYQLLGWYSPGKEDPVAKLVVDNPGDDAATLQEKIKAHFGWTVELAGEKPAGMCCYAEVAFDPNADVVNTRKNDSARAAIGNTGTEALSAWMATHLSGADKGQLEDQLESLLAQDGLQSKVLDLECRFKEARQEQNFTAVSGGSLWEVKPVDQGGGDVKAPAHIALPPSLADTLDQVNAAQQRLDRATQQLEDKRQALFGDWYKYMLCAYPPNYAMNDYPDVDYVKYYITNTRIPQVQNAIDHISTCTDEFASKLADFDQQLTDFNSDPLQQHQYERVRIPAPRFWHPNEPVVLLEGEAMKPTLRHGEDGRLSDDNTLQCQLSETNNYPFQTGDTDQLLTAIETYRPAADEEKIGFDTWKMQPWYPFILEWEVQVFPMKEGGNVNTSGTGNFSPDFVKDNFDLNPDEPGLTVKAGKETVEAATLYRGHTVLTAYAKKRIERAVADSLDRLAREDCYQVVGTIPEADKATYMNDLEAWYATKPDTYGDDPAGYRNWYLDKPVYDGGSAYFKDLALVDQLNDFNYVLIETGGQVAASHFISQALSGFNEALLMQEQTLQLPVADPIGFDDYRAFAGTLNLAIDDNSNVASKPLNDFLPLRSGTMKLHRFRVVDTFGQAKDIDISSVSKSETLDNSLTVGVNNSVWLPPCFTQPARLNFRWLSAHSGLQELNTHPDTTPVCGWLLANHLDNSLAVYDRDGHPLGIIDQRAKWRSFPGNDTIVNPANFANAYLQKVVERLALIGDETDTGGTKATFLQDFITAADRSLEHIDPETFAHHKELALLIGRPIAVTRVSVNLELKGDPASHQGWNAFRIRLENGHWDTDDFQKITVPVRIGERGQFNDGVAGYWIEDNTGALEQDFYTTADPTAVSNDRIKSHEDIAIYHSLTDAPQRLTLLIDPRGEAHATTGILPVKVIRIPETQYTKALERLEMPILAAPMLTGKGRVALPLPDGQDLEWSWLARDRFRWAEVSRRGILRKDHLIAAFAGGSDLWQLLLDIGWTVELDGNRAHIVPADQRIEATLGPPFDQLTDRIEALLNAGYIAPVSTDATFDGKQIIREGWLKLSP